MRTRFIIASAIILAGCGGPSGTADGGADCTGSDCPDAGSVPFKGCTVVFSGDFAETDLIDGGCAVVVPEGAAVDAGISTVEMLAAGGFTNSNPDGGPDWILQIQAYSQAISAPMVVLVDLGPSPSPGLYNADTGQNWSAVSLDPSGCEFVAGQAAVPEGSFTANVTSVGSLTSGLGTAHGTLQVTQYTEASAATDLTYCGTANTEQVAITF